MKKLLMILVALLISQNISAQIKIYGNLYQSGSRLPAANVQITVEGTDISAVSSPSGKYSVTLSEIGEYQLIFKSQSGETIKRKINITKYEDIKIDLSLVTDVYNTDEIVVYGASRRAEKITESPAALTVIFSEELERKSRSGQLANSLAGNVGVDVLRNGANDFIVNTRGFNSGLNRRLLVLQDGRDVAMPLLGALEWNSFALPQEDFERVELVRGPAAALYGANAFNGVLLMKSHRPKDITGTKISLLGGDFETYKADVRHAGVISDFSYKINFGYSRMLNLINRRDSLQFLEYKGLPIERRKINDDERQTFSGYGSLRLDYDIDSKSTVTTEFGYSRSGNEAYVFGLGRTFVKDAERPYARLAYNSENINIHAHYMSRFTPDTMWLLVPNAPLLDNSKDIVIDFQHNFAISDDVHFIWGITEQLQYIRTYGTSIPNDVDADFTGVYAQGEWNLRPNLKLIASSRFDYASIHSSQFSPRFSIVYSPTANHQFRLSINRAFQRPNYSELYRLTPDAPAFSQSTGAPINFQAIENKIADSIAFLSGIRPDLNLNLSAMRSVALGNDNLKVEKIMAYELGYKVALSSNIFFSADFFYNRLNDFITNFLPAVNSNIEAWQANLDESIAQYSELATDMLLNELSPRDRARLSNLNGNPTFVVSNSNVGAVDEYGAELEIIYEPVKNLRIKADYSYFGYKVVENESSQPLLPNTSPHRFNIAINYIKEKSFDVGVSLMYSEGFDWLAGTFYGYVPSYAVVNLNAGYEILNNLSIGINVFNVLNRKHYQIFGGTYLPRMATMRLSLMF